MTVRNLLNKINPILILLLILSTFLSNPAPVSAGPLAPPVQGLSVADLIKPDGSLKTPGISGALNLAGWDVNLDPQRGPVFAPSASGIPYEWSALGAGTNNSVKAMIIQGTNVIVGGLFTSAGTCSTADGCNGIAQWSTTSNSWSAVGGGISGRDGDVNAIVKDGTDLYVGGNFTSAGGVEVANIAKWNGTSWSALGAGVDSPENSGNVKAIAISGTDVYVGGDFTYSGSSATPLSYIAKWDGINWSPLGKGMYGEDYSVDTIAIDSEGKVYVGGGFSSAKGTVPADDCTDCKYIAIWDGTKWSPLGTGTNGTVFVIAIDSVDSLYVGGYFTSANSVANTKYIAKWSEGSWSPLGTGTGYSVNAISINDSGTDVYVGGWFNTVADCAVPADCQNIAKWSTTSNSWSALNKGFFSSGYYDQVYAIALKGGAVFAGGSFSKAGNAAAGDTPASNIAVFLPSTSTSTTISTSVPAEGSALASSPSTLTVKFSAAVVHDLSTNAKSATSLSNYMLVGTGLNSIFDTTVDASAICSAAHTPSGDDLNISIASISYDATNFIATLTIAPASLPLAAGPYRLYVCGKDSIRDNSDNKINGGANFPVNFSVGSSAAAADKYSKLPKTGFAPNRISVLPQQPENAAYTKMSGLWLEIPSQKMQANIVGVPLAYRNWDVTWLGNDAGWLNGTAYPTWLGNSVITAHVTTAKGLPGPFANLKNLGYGNKIVVHQFGEKYTFEVRDTRLVFPDTTGYTFEHLSGKSYLTLITCQGYNFLTDNYMFRRVVRAVLVKVEADK